MISHGRAGTSSIVQVLVEKLVAAREHARFGLHASVAYRSEPPPDLPDEDSPFRVSRVPPLDADQLRRRHLTWVLGGVFRDALEGVGLSLDGAHDALLSMHGQSSAGTNASSEQFEKKPIGDKMKWLERKFEGFRPPNIWPEVLTLNRLRNCLVHRYALVGPIDAAPDGALFARWFRLAMVSTGPGEPIGREIRVGERAPENSGIGVQALPVERSFRLGETVALTSQDVSEVLFTLYLFGEQLAGSVADIKGNS
jgi:hypothetical protein